MRSRLEFSAVTKREAHERSGGLCECHMIPWLARPDGCGMKLTIGNIFYEHINPDRIRPDNSLLNCATLVRICWRQKTADYDLPVIAKSNRTRDLARNIKQERKGRPLVGTIASGIKLSLNGGTPTWRDSGRPVFGKSRS